MLTAKTRKMENKNPSSKRLTDSLVLLANDPAKSALYFNADTLQRLNSLFRREKDYRRHMTSLWITRRQILNLIKARPELSSALKPQFDTLNELIAALLPNHPSDYPRPPYRD